MLCNPFLCILAKWQKCLPRDFFASIGILHKELRVNRGLKRVLQGVLEGCVYCPIRFALMAGRFSWGVGGYARARAIH